MAVGSLGEPAEMTDLIPESETEPRARPTAAESVPVIAQRTIARGVRNGQSGTPGRRRPLGSAYR